MKIRCLSILFVVSLFSNNSYAMEWNGARPIIDKMLSYYETHPNYSMIIFDEWIKSDGSREAVGDTIFAHKYNDYGYIKNGPQIQVYTEQFDILINEDQKTMNVRGVGKEELVEISKMIPSMATVLKYFELCDSSRIIKTDADVQIVDFYFNHPLMNKTRMVIDKTGKVRELYRYYTKADEYIAQHTVFVLVEPLDSPSIEVLKQDNYIQVTKTKKEVDIQPAGKYKDFNFQLIKF